MTIFSSAHTSLTSNIVPDCGCENKKDVEGLGLLSSLLFIKVIINSSSSIEALAFLF